MERYKVVMLPTEKASYLFTEKGKLRYANASIKRSGIIDGSEQHLYIVDTQATINVGDRFIIKGDNTVFMCMNPNGFQTSDEWKIIASTDSTLGLPLCNDEYFLQAVVSYGVDGIDITSVNVNTYFNTCSISWKKKIIEHNLCIPSYENNREVEFPKSTREKAVVWWKALASDKQLDYWRTYQQVTFTPSHSPDELTGREIEEIYNKIHFPVNQKVVEQLAKPQVDIESFIFSVEKVSLGISLNEAERANFTLCFDYASKSSSFMHKLHKKLKIIKS